MRKAAAIAVEAHRAAMTEATPGGFEYQVDALIDYTFRRNGCTGRAYPNIVAGGQNACILHYITNDAALADGELLLVDAGAEWNYYASDVTGLDNQSVKSPAEAEAFDELINELLEGGHETVAELVSLLKPRAETDGDNGKAQFVLSNMAVQAS